jgi:GDP-mannose 6-dehydrogenase
LIGIIERIVGAAQPAAYCVHPEFLREGQAVADFFEPPKIVYGPTDAAAAAVIPDLYPGIVAPQEIMEPAAAALVKYADNCFHAVMVTFGNEIGLLAASFGVDAREVMRVFCLDTKLNISPHYLAPGRPFGGSCLPKDVRAVNAWSREQDIELPMLGNVMRSNGIQVDAIVRRIVALRPARVALLGLAFKDDTDDLRESPMLAIFGALRQRGFDVTVFDPVVNRDMIAALSANAELDDIQSRVTDDVASLVARCELTVVARRQLGVDLGSLPWPEGAVVFDLVGLEGPLNSQKVFGLYW